MSISWILLIAAVLCYLQQRYFKRWGFAGLKVSREFDRTHCHAGERIEMIETITNRKLMPIPWLRLESMIHAGLHFEKQTNLDVTSGSLFQNHKSLFSLTPYTKIVRRHRIRCVQRGWYRLETVAVSIGDMLGIQAASRIQQTGLELLVYPRIVPLAEFDFPSSSWQGDVAVKRWIVQDPFLSSGVREYRYGDTMASIHWKSTARSQRLQVHSREFTADPKLMIVLNTQVVETMWDTVTDPELIETGIAFAASLAHDAIGKGISVGFAANTYTQDQPDAPIHVPPEGGWNQMEYLLVTMAKLALACCRNFHGLLEEEADWADTATDFVLITPFVSEAVQDRIEVLRAQGHSVHVVELHHGLLGVGGKEAEDSHAAS